LTRHLLIWEEVPDDTKAFILIEGVDDTIIDLAQQSMGYYINAEDNDAIHKLNDELTNRDPDYHHCSHEVIKDGPFIAVYICGFVL
jgi:hypothetical protein